MIVDGQAEFRSLPLLLRKIETPFVLLSPLYADIQPYAPAGQIAGAVATRLPIVASRHVDLAVILLDREARPECPGEIADRLCALLAAPCQRCGIPRALVVVKNRMYENWLISDSAAFRGQRGRFRLSAAQVRTLDSGRADTLDGLAVLENAVRGDAYSKVADAVRIIGRAEPLRMAGNSRSFRRFLRVVGHPRYARQSRNP